MLGCIYFLATAGNRKKEEEERERKIAERRTAWLKDREEKKQNIKLPDKISSINTEN